MDNMVQCSVGLFKTDERERASEKAMSLIAEGHQNVHIEIVWREYNLHHGPYVGFYASYYEPL